MIRATSIVILSAGVLLPAVSTAVPNPSFVLVPDWIPVVGTQQGVPHPGQSILFVIHDPQDNPVPGAIIELDFSACTDIRLCDAVVAGAGRVFCGSSTVVAETDALGAVSLTVIGAGTHAGFGIGTDPAIGQGCVEVRLDGVVLDHASAYVLDHNGAVGGNGHNGLDLALSALDYFDYSYNKVYRARSDYVDNGSMAITGLDLSAHKIMLIESMSGHGSATGCRGVDGPASYCP